MARLERDLNPLDFAGFAEPIGAPASWSDWIAITQTRIDGFAEHTGDDAFIHTDPARAAATRFGGTIAHGLLTLSLLPLMRRSAVPNVADARMSVNYGFDQIRFLAPVPVNSRVRGGFAVTGAEITKPGFGKITYAVTVEIEGIDRPALAASWTIGHWLSQEKS